MSESNTGKALTIIEIKERKTIVEWVRLASYSPVSKAIVARILREKLLTVIDEDEKKFLTEQLAILKGERR